MNKWKSRPNANNVQKITITTWVLENSQYYMRLIKLTKALI